MCYGEGRGIGGGITGSLFWCCEVVSVGLQWMLLILGSCAQALHTPGPSEVPPKSWTGYTLSGNGKGSVLYRALSL